MARTRSRRIAVWLAVGACMGLGACSTLRNGYANHAPAPSLEQPDKPATDSQAMYLDLIRQMQQQGAYYASLAHIDAFRLRYGNPPALQRLQAEALRETGQDDAAAKVYQGMLRGSEAAAAWHGLGLIAAGHHQFGEADDDLLRATRLEPINVTYLNDLGYARLEAGGVGTAHQPLAEAAELEPANVKVVSNLALWASLSGDDAQAEAIMQRANLPPATRDAVRKLALRMRMEPIADVTSSSNPNPPAGDNTVLAKPAQGIPSTLLGRFGATASSEDHP
jgi:Flp pilus assembly protein TadD